MKEFENWWENNHREIWLSRSTKRVAAKDGWKAALEWMSKLIGIRSPDGRLGQRSFVDELKALIDEELNNE